MNCRRRKGASPGTNVKPVKASTSGRAPAGGVTRTSGAKPKDYKMVPETPSTSGRVLKYNT